MIDTLLNLEPPVQAALIAAVVGFTSGVIGTYFKHFLDKRALRDKIEIEYQYAERKKLRELIGRYHGRMLEAAERLNHRFWNLQENESKDWLNMSGEYNSPESNYYFTTTVYRTVELLTLVRLFDSEAIFIDARIARERELIFARFAKAFEWALTDTDLFKGISYETFWQTDHLFHDKLRLLCESCISEGKIISIDKFQERLKSSDKNLLVPLLSFFDGLRANEKRLRWDRVVVFHLLLMAFINAFGYDIQKSSVPNFIEIATSIKNKPILENLVRWLPKLGLTKEGRNIVVAANSITV